MCSELDKDTKTKTVSLRKGHKIKLPDAIIAATAIVNGLTLLTRNVSDFQAISDLSFINPWDK
ncbi:PIN domain-containing protein [Puia sp. P3]|uniref:PIN domain-containing protein n=1 Tax=Puia sp. P3 TaxID=3423952 RepID=UPI003D673B00